MNDYPEKIYDLLEQTRFEAMTQQDRELVLQHMTEAEFRQMQSLWSKVQMEEKNTTAENPNVWNSLQKEFKNEHRNNVVPLWKRSIPVYKAAAAVLIPVLLTVLYYEQFRVKNSGENVISIADTVYVKGSTDTVFIKPESIPVTVPVIKVVQKEKEELRGSVPLSKDSTYLELTSGII